MVFHEVTLFQPNERFLFVKVKVLSSNSKPEPVLNLPPEFVLVFQFSAPHSAVKIKNRPQLLEPSFE